MRSLFLVAPALAFTLGACGGGDDTSPGTLTAVHNTGGFCQASAPWCGWDVVLTGDEVTITSKTATGTATGHLTAAGREELDALVASLPVDSKDDHTLTCADAPTLTLDITFDHGGAHSYSYSCTPGVFQDLSEFVSDISGALITGHGDARIDVAASVR